MLVFGHRGSPGSPRFGENTITSFEKALAAGAHGLEFDVRRCGDGQLVVIHDETVNRTTNGKGLVSRLSYKELELLDAGHGEGIPLLSTVLDRFGSRCLLNIELKETGISLDVKRLIDERSLKDTVLVSSFNWRELKPLAGTVPIALLSSTSDNLISSAVALGAAAIHPRKDIVRAPLLEAAREAKLRVHVWTVNEHQEIAALRDARVDAIFSDLPERCLTSAS